MKHKAPAQCARRRAMAATSVFTLALPTLVFSTACAPETTIDTVPPRVVQVSPSSPLVRVDADFVVTFSEPMYDVNLNLDTIVVIETDVYEADSTFESDFRNAPLSDTRKARVFPGELDISSDQSVVTFRPLRPLDPDTRYSLLLSEDVRDLEGNPLADATGLASIFRLDFLTDDGPPTLIEHDVTAPDRPLVPPNRRRFTIWFDQPVLGLDRDSMVIRRAAGGGEVAVDAIEIGPNRDRATLILAEDEDCEVLAPSEDYVVAVGPGITDDEGEPMPAEEIEFATSTECDLARHRIVGEPLAIAGESTSTLSFVSTRASSTLVRFGRAGGPMDCLGAPCPVDGAFAREPSEPGRYSHTVSLTGLDVNEEYAFTVLAQDVFGGVATADGTFVTAPIADISVNEVMADSPTVPDANGEFVELVNYGEDAIDLSGFTLQISDNNPCTIPEDGTVVLEAGDYLVLAGADWDGSVYNGVDGARVLNISGASSVCGSLVNSEASTVLLKDADGRPVSSITGYGSLSPRGGRSIERVSALEGDVVSNFCYSRIDVGPTPGQVNGVALNGCEDS